MVGGILREFRLKAGRQLMTTILKHYIGNSLHVHDSHRAANAVPIVLPLARIIHEE